jgi:hypothetical protein
MMAEFGGHAGEDAGGLPAPGESVDPYDPSVSDDADTGAEGDYDEPGSENPYGDLLDGGTGGGDPTPVGGGPAIGDPANTTYPAPGGTSTGSPTGVGGSPSGGGGGGGASYPGTGGGGGATTSPVNEPDRTVSSGEVGQQEDKQGHETVETEYEQVETGQQTSGPAFEGLKGDVAGELSQKLMDFMNDPTSFYNQAGMQLRSKELAEMVGNVARQKGLTGGIAASLTGRELGMQSAREADSMNNFFTNMMGQVGGFGDYGGSVSQGTQTGMFPTKKETKQEGTVVKGPADTDPNTGKVNPLPPIFL